MTGTVTPIPKTMRQKFLSDAGDHPKHKLSIQGAAEPQGLCSHKNDPNICPCLLQI